MALLPSVEVPALLLLSSAVCTASEVESSASMMSPDVMPAADAPLPPMEPRWPLWWPWLLEPWRKKRWVVGRKKVRVEWRPPSWPPLWWPLVPCRRRPALLESPPLLLLLSSRSSLLRRLLSSLLLLSDEPLELRLLSLLWWPWWWWWCSELCESWCELSLLKWWNSPELPRPPDRERPECEPSPPLPPCDECQPRSLRLTLTDLVSEGAAPVWERVGQGKQQWV